MLVTLRFSGKIFLGRSSKLGERKAYEPLFRKQKLSEAYKISLGFTGALIGFHSKIELHF